jgi:hypothetical protein
MSQWYEFEIAANLYWPFISNYLAWNDRKIELTWTLPALPVLHSILKCFTKYSLWCMVTVTVMLSSALWKSNNGHCFAYVERQKKSATALKSEKLSSTEDKKVFCSVLLLVTSMHVPGTGRYTYTLVLYYSRATTVVIVVQIVRHCTSQYLYRTQRLYVLEVRVLKCQWS